MEIFRGLPGKVKGCGRGKREQVGKRKRIKQKPQDENPHTFGKQI